MVGPCGCVVDARCLSLALPVFQPYSFCLVIICPAQNSSTTQCTLHARDCFSSGTDYVILHDALTTPQSLQIHDPIDICNSRNLPSKAIKAVKGTRLSTLSLPQRVSFGSAAHCRRLLFLPLHEVQPKILLFKFALDSPAVIHY